MSEKEQLKKKPVKYNDAETRKPGSSIETPFKHNDIRNKFRDSSKLNKEVVQSTSDEVAKEND